MLIDYWVRIVTEDLPEGDPEDWRFSFARALAGLRPAPARTVTSGFDAERRRMVLTFIVKARTGSGALEMLNHMLRRLGEHPELIAVRQIQLYPSGDQGVISVDDVFETFGPAQWDELMERYHEPDFEYDA